MTEPKKQVLSHRVRRGENDLATLFPSLLEEWDYELNELNPSDFTAFSNQHAYWVCSRGHRWTAIIESRTRIGSGCPFCSNRVVTPNENDLATLFPEIAKEWDFDQNTKGPEQYLAKSDEKVGWICQKCGHRWQSYIKHRTNGSGCPRCKRHISNNKQAACIKRPSVRLGENDLASQRPNLLDEWDYEQNKLPPERYSVFSHMKVWWVCKMCKTPYQARIEDRAKGSGCMHCLKRNAHQRKVL